MSDPTQLLKQLCARYGVPSSFGKKLEPLLVRAQAVDPEARQRILDLVTRSFEEEARRLREEERLSAGPSILDPQARKVLRTVAAVLHGWTPPSWLVAWGEGHAK